MNPTGDLPAGRYQMAMTAAGKHNDIIVLHGGMNTSFNALGDLWILDMSKQTMQWEAVDVDTEIVKPRWGHTLTTVAPDLVLMFGRLRI